MFTPTHFVDTDERGAEINRVENGQLVQEVRRTLTAFTSTPIVDVVTEDGEERSLFAERLAEFDPDEHKVTCQWDHTAGHRWQQSPGDEPYCPGARVVLPEPETVDALPLLVDYLRSLSDALDGIAGGVRAMVDVLDQAEAQR